MIFKSTLFLNSNFIKTNLSLFLFILLTPSLAFSQAPVNDECSGAISVPITPANGLCDATVTGTLENATQSSLASPVNVCGGTADDDVWFKFVATSAKVSINKHITNDPGWIILSLYEGTCASIGPELYCFSSNNNVVDGLTIGNTYFIRIFSGGTFAKLTEFNLCVQELGACDTPINQDYCVAPALLTAGPGDFSSNTSGTYSKDTPANLLALISPITIENNSWYEFVAHSTTEIFNFTSVSGCTQGIQAVVFNVTTDANGCCTNFELKSNLWNPTSAVPGVVTASGLTIGEKYFLMVDGYSNDICDFTVSDWSAIGILPITLRNFDGVAVNDKNYISWSTLTETNNDKFNILRSLDGVNFEKIGEVKGAGNSISNLRYQFEDNNIESKIMYYQLQQVDFDGNSTKSDVIAITREGVVKNLFLSPNPVLDHLFLQIGKNKSGVIEIKNTNGMTVYTEEISKSNSTTISTQNLQKGVYYIQFTSEEGRVTTKRFIKI